MDGLNVDAINSMKTHINSVLFVIGIYFIVKIFILIFGDCEKGDE